MGTQDRKKRERKHRQEQILNAAISLIEDQGFENTTMDEIAKRAELSKGTLYLYFDDKVTLYHAIKKRALKFVRNQFQRILKEDLKGAEIVKEMMLAFIQLIKENATFTKAMLLYENANKNDDKKHSEISDCTHLENELLMLIIRSIQIGVQDGSINSSTNPKILALQIGFQMRGMLQFYIVDSTEKAHQIIQENNLGLDELTELFLDTQFKVTA